MSGYSPIFDSVFQGSLCGRYPELPVWLVLLALQQRGGIIDAHPSYIATVSGIPQPDIESAIRSFCEPDPHSRTPDCEGRRLIPLEGRGFGWRIVNHDKYRAKARKRDYDEARTESGEDAARKRAERDAQPGNGAGETPPSGPSEPGNAAAGRRESRLVPTSPDESRRVPLSEAEAEAFKNPLPSVGGGARTRASRRAPPGWQPPPEAVDAMRTECPGVDIEASTRQFLDHEFAKPKSDWLATWRNWVRRDFDKLSLGRGRTTRYEQGRRNLAAKAGVTMEELDALGDF